MSSTMAAMLAATPGPSARITITGIVGAASVQIFRGDGAREVRVSGDDQQIPSGAVFLTDYRLSPGRTVTYRAVLYSALGVAIETVFATPFTVPDIDPSFAWVMDPEDPTNALLVPLMVGTDGSVSHQSAAVVVTPLQGLPILLGGPRTALARTFIVETTTASESAQFDQIIRPGGALLIRPGSAMRHDTGLVYMGAPVILEAPRHPYEGPDRWTIEGTEVADDNWPVIVTERTWIDDIEYEGATWYDIEARYATWLDLEQG